MAYDEEMRCLLACVYLVLGGSLVAQTPVSLDKVTPSVLLAGQLLPRFHLRGSGFAPGTRIRFGALSPFAVAVESAEAASFLLPATS